MSRLFNSLLLTLAAVASCRGEPSSPPVTTASPDGAAPSPDPSDPPGGQSPDQHPTPRTDGSPCESADDCASGICEGEGCTADSPGACAAASRMCTRDLQQYCGCDGETFGASGNCPGRRFAARGPC